MMREVTGSPDSAAVRLDNGVLVTAVRRDRYPLSTLHVSVPVWNSDLAVGSVLSATLFDESAFERTGYSLSGSCASDALTVRGVGLPEDFRSGVAATRTSLTDPSHSEEDVRRARLELSRQVQLGRDIPARVAWRELLAELYGRHPLAVLSAEVDALREVSGADVARFRQRHVGADGAVVVVSGHLPLEEMLEVVAEEFSSLSGTTAGPPEVVHGEGGATRTVHRAGAAQVALMLGFRSVSRGDPAFPVAALTNLVVGGYFSSRLSHRLRQENGYAYWVRSSLAADPIGPALAIATNVRAGKADAALQVIRDDLAELADTGPTVDELDHAKRHLAGSMRHEMVGQANVAELVFELARNGLSPDWPQRHVAEVREVTTSDVQEFARTFLRPERATTVLVGDQRELAA